MRINMKLLPILLSLFFLGFNASGQSGESDDKSGPGDRIQSAKVAFITNRLNLNSNQAQLFWPIFNEFESSKKKIRKQLRRLKFENEFGGGTEEELKTDIKKMFSLRQEELDLEKSYSEKFMKVISARQLADFYKAEKEFTKMLLKKLKSRKGDLNLDGNED